jgi:hypothetical protein
MNHHQQLSQNIFKFERQRLGKSTKYGLYLYRNTVTGELVASHEYPYNERALTSWDNPNCFLLMQPQFKPQQTFTLKKKLFNGSDIGLQTDALFYYKNV